MGSHGAGISCECGQLGSFSSLMPVNPCTKATRLWFSWCDEISSFTSLISLPSSRFCSTQIGDRDLAEETRAALAGQEGKGCNYRSPATIEDEAPLCALALWPRHCQRRP